MNEPITRWSRRSGVALMVACGVMLASCETTPSGSSPAQADATSSSGGAHTAAPGAADGHHADLINEVGTELVTADGESVTSSELADNQYVVLYFSAGWCPPCRRYTPSLVEFHENHSDRGVEVVFVSSDRDADSMAEYMDDADMPWLAVPYEQIDDSGLKSKYEVRGIPRVVVLDGSNGIVMDSNDVNRNEIPERLAQMLD